MIGMKWFRFLVAVAGVVTALVIVGMVCQETWPTAFGAIVGVWALVVAVFQVLQTQEQQQNQIDELRRIADGTQRTGDAADRIAEVQEAEHDANMPRVVLGKGKNKVDSRRQDWRFQVVCRNQGGTTAFGVHMRMADQPDVDVLVGDIPAGEATDVWFLRGVSSDRVRELSGQTLVVTWRDATGQERSASYRFIAELAADNRHLNKFEIVPLPESDG